VPGYETLSTEAVINLHSLPSSHLNIRANTNSNNVGSVRFAYDGDSMHVENFSPFALFGDNNGDYAEGELLPGQHTLCATPFTESSAAGAAGRSLTIAFTVTQNGPEDSGFDDGSSRGYIGLNRDELISEFVIAGDQPKTIVLRALGRSLSRFGIKNGLADPSLALRDSTGALLAFNDNWRDSQRELFIRNGAYHRFRPFNDLEPAIAIQLRPGTYRAIISGNNGSHGEVLAEVFDASNSLRSRLVAVSTRGFVHVNDMLIGGFSVKSQTGTNVILRALGPSLLSSRLGPVLMTPSLAIFDEKGNLVGYNERWQDDRHQAELIARSGLAPKSANESAIARKLAAGRYTVIVRGRDNSAGVALLESYDVSE
jgi:hypothetical protein